MNLPFVSRRQYDAIYACLEDALRLNGKRAEAYALAKEIIDIEHTARIRAYDQIRFKDASIRKALALPGFREKTS